MVIDTESATGSGLLVIEALRLSASGHTADEIVRRTKELVPRVKVIATLDTLYYLLKGGRVPVLAHLGSSLLQVKPIFEMYRGEVRTLAKVRTSKRAKGRLVDLLHEDVGEEKLHAAVLQGNVPGEARELEERIASEFNCGELYVGTFSPVIGAHTGPGLLGVSYWSESETA